MVGLGKKMYFLSVYIMDRLRKALKSKKKEGPKLPPIGKRTNSAILKYYKDTITPQKDLKPLVKQFTMKLNKNGVLVPKGGILLGKNKKRKKNKVGVEG
jgi:hypothetical protein